MKKRSKWLIGISLTLIVIVGFGVGYVMDYYHALPYTLSDNVKLEISKNISLEIMEDKKDIGIVIYPGGKVESTVYIPLLMPLAEDGYTVIIANMPLNLAVLDVNRMNSIKKDHPEIKEWYMVGHSLGGAMAASYVASHDDIEGLVLLGAYSTKSLVDYDGSIAQFVGTNDLIVNRKNLDKNKVNLPGTACIIDLEGSNHSQFGNYGHQKGDGTASISQAEQMEYVVNALNLMINQSMCK